MLIRRLYLAEARAAAAGPEPLLRRWWIGDTSLNSDDALPFGLIPRGKTGPVLKIGKGSPRGWRGGALVPPIWVRKGDKLELQLENRSKLPMAVRFQLKEDFKHLLPESRGKVILQPGISKASLSVDADGLANYFVVLAPTADLYLHEGCSIKRRWR